MIVRHLILATAALLVSASAYGQSSDGNGQPPSETSQQIVVRGFVVPEGDIPVRPVSGMVSAATRQFASEADRFVRCSGLPRPRDLHKMLDNNPDLKPAQIALHNYVVRNTACYGTVPPPIPSSPYFGSCNPQLLNNGSRMCRATFDRGVVYEQALRDFGGAIPLSRNETFDKSVIARFKTREDERNHERLELGKEFFETLGCMVQISPNFATALLDQPPGTDREGKLRNAIISEGAPCVGYAKEVRVDPSEFRAFLAEAVYSWKVAVKESDSLVPGAM